VKRPDEKRRDRGGHADERRRQFEESRGLSGRRALRLDEAATDEEAEGGSEPVTPENPEEEPDRDESK
jgi:hypothetical protein